MRTFFRRFPTLTASAVYALLVAVVFHPFWRGMLLLTTHSDQFDGYAFRKFAADYVRANGSFPQWNPYIFGGMPFLQNVTNGDTFYWTAWLRLIMPVGSAMALGFMVHLVLAATFAFLFLRTLRLSWGASFLGGLAYAFSGQVLSLVSPGHDGKMFVSALAPLALTMVHRAVTRADWRYYVFFGATIGASMLTPQNQLTYYTLMACGFYWLFLNFFSGERPADVPWWKSALFFGGALLIAFAIDAIQLLPFRENLTLTGRGAAGSSSTGWEYATSFSMPPEELINVLWPGFSGFIQSYWGRNPLKLHSEYLGVVVLILATFSFRLRSHRRYAWFFVFLIGYATLFALGGYTPFYHLPYALLPLIKSTRAPSMIFFLVSLSAAILAAFGTEALTQRSREGAAEQGGLRPLWIWLGVVAFGALLALSGGFRNVMTTVAIPERMDAMEAAYPTFMADALRVAVMAGLLAGIIILGRRMRVSGEALAVAMAAVVAVDLWSVEQRYINWSPPESVTFAPDEVVQTLRADTAHFRVLEFAPAYMGHNYLASQRVRQMLGYQGTELHRYDELLGGKNEWANATNPAVWRVTAAKYVITGAIISPLPPFLAPVGDRSLRTHAGDSARVYRFVNADPYAYLVREAVKVTDEQALPSIADPRSKLDPRRLMLVAQDAPVGLDASALKGLPDAVDAPVAVSEPHAGLLRFSFAPQPTPTFLFVSENWYPAWKATVDGREAPVLRAQLSLMGVPVPAGAKSVELRVDDATYHKGKLITLLALAGVIAVIVLALLRPARIPVRG